MREIMHVFVAKGAGHVGSKPVSALPEKGYFVTVYDLYLYGMDLFESFNIRTMKAMELK